jgi:2-dehydropantoate 2-reductase
MAAAGRVLPPLVSLQNGVGNEEALAAAFRADSIVAGALDTPVSVPAPGQVQVHRPRYRAGVAPVGPQAPAHMAAGLLRSAGFEVTLNDDYRRLKWSKLLLNLLANASCAILDWTPAQVMAHPVTAELEARAWQEALAVMAAHGIRPVMLARYPLPLVAPLARRAPSRWLGRVLRGLVSGGRGSKMPSLHIALAGGRRSEVNWLNGAVVRYGVERSIPTPVNRALSDVLTALTVGAELWDAWRGDIERLGQTTNDERRTTNVWDQP